ncbi:hypothetical protein C2845_PM01G32610 [Panicum miliaceum]|uniref:RNA polymerase Rpb5 N-terminal domain-containing protein n=1 Tax=Panicum miliaceum TaxID=4540 RepID=A0A3L6TRZ2_PANMI|nr:hypothetical protein C2845_PM01G32610 [Panicum miliaceum]
MSAGLVTDEATMMRDRRYLVVENELATSHRDFLHKFGESFYREDLRISKYRKNDPSGQMGKRR